jgi:F0F1-type ATP synthase alpha subunit
MNEQQKKHLNESNKVSTSPELVAVVQYDEDTMETVVLLNNQTIKDGDEVEYNGKKFLVEVDVEDVGEVPDEIDHSVVVRTISTDAWDEKEKAIITTHEAVYGTKPGRTIVDGIVDLSIGGVAIDPDNEGDGSHVICHGDEGTITLDRWAFTVPNTVWGFKPAKSGKKPADE